MSNNEKLKSLSSTDKFLSAAHRFEFVIITILYFTITIISVLAITRLGAAVYDRIFGPWDDNTGQGIQILFGMVMTVLISLELGNSMLRNLKRRTTVIQAQEIILIGLIAIVRKIMLVDINVVTPTLIASLAIATITLAAAYWLTKEAAHNH